MNKAEEYSRLLVDELEEMRIIGVGKSASFWEEYINLTTSSEVTNICSYLINYLKDTEKIDIEELNILKDLVDEMTLGINRERGLNDKDLIFKERINEMSMILKGFFAGLMEKENPSVLMNDAYQAGRNMQYKLKQINKTD